MGQNCIFSLIRYPVAGQPKWVVVALKTFFKGKIGFCQKKTLKNGSKLSFSYNYEKIRPNLTFYWFGCLRIGF